MKVFYLYIIGIIVAVVGIVLGICLAETATVTYSILWLTYWIICIIIDYKFSKDKGKETTTENFDVDEEAFEKALEQNRKDLAKAHKYNFDGIKME